MDQPSSNAPMMPGSSPNSIFQTWIKALTKPNEQTYMDIANSPNAKATTAYTWVFLSSLLTSLFTLIVQGETLRNQLAQSGIGQGRLGSGFGAVAITLLCGTPIIAIIGTISFAIGVAIIQWIAKMFGGKGTNDQLAYSFAAFGVPYSLISSLFILLSAIPFVGLCLQIILSLAGFYIFFLEILAVKSVNQFGWGQAVGSVLIPFVVVLILCCCVFIGLGFVMGPAIKNIFSQFNQGFTP